jgi:hypothetical protein
MYDTSSMHVCVYVCFVVYTCMCICMLLHLGGENGERLCMYVYVGVIFMYCMYFICTYVFMRVDV